MKSPSVKIVKKINVDLPKVGYKADKTKAKSRDPEIIFVFLQPYSPDLNLVEFIWKTIKREVSARFVQELIPKLILF